MTRLFITISLVLCAFIIQGRSFPGNTSGRPAAVASMQGKHAPLSFIENKGQVMDQYRKPRTDIQFRVAAAPGLNIFIGDGAIHYQFSKPDSTTASVETQDFASLPHCGKAQPSSKQQSKFQIPNSERATFTMYRMDVELIGANKNAQVITEEKQGYYENYFNENTNGRTVTAHTYNRVTYKNIYPHIDWILYISSGQLKHEFVVNEGGNAADIQLKYGGATGIKLNTDGSLAAATPQGIITEQAPNCYQQDGKAVTSNFKIMGDLLTYEIGSYSGRLVIDPALEWATYFGGSNADLGKALSLDGSGNAYITGYTLSISGMATTGAYQSVCGGDADAFLAKFDSAGTIQWATYYGGSGTEITGGVAIDGSENIFIAGYTTSTSGVATPGAYKDTLSGTEDAFLAKFNSAGSIQWATYYGGSGINDASGVATDGLGNAYIAGSTQSPSDIATPGAYKDTLSGIENAFLAKFDSTGNIQWATYYGDGGDYAFGTTTDGSDNVYITGQTYSISGIATPGAYQDALPGVNSGYLAKFNTAGVILWATYFGGNYGGLGYCVATDQYENVYITGNTPSTTGIATPGAYQVTEGDGATFGDAFLAKFNSAGSIQWATYYGGLGQDVGYGVAADDFGNVYITGLTLSASGIATAGAYQTIYSGGLSYGDAFIAKFNTLGAIQWASYYGGSGDEMSMAVATTTSGDVYITGNTSSVSDIATSGAYQAAYGGGTYDAFLAKFDICAMPNTGIISGIDSVCTDSTIMLADTISSGIWSSANTAIATITAGMVRGRAVGLDTIKYTVSNACGTASAQKLIYVTNDCTEGVKAISKSGDIAIYPNPAQSELTITSSTQIASIIITNLLGQVVHSQTGKARQVQVDMAGLPAGVYFVRINGAEVRKFVKQ